MTILPDVPSEQYHRDELADTPTLSASIATILVNQSPAHARAAHPKLNPNLVQEVKKEWDVGTAAHSLLLEGNDVVHVVEGYDNWRTKDSQAEAFMAREVGKIPMLRKEWEEVSAMVDAAREQIAAFEAVPPLLTDGKAEVTIVCEMDGVLCRTRIDHLRDDFAAICDYKTAQSANQRKFADRTVYDNGYAIKAAFYMRAVKQISGVTPAFRWIVQEKKAPYVLSVVEPGEDVLALANEQVQYAIDLWRGCLERDEWPTYGTRIATAELPPWVEAQWMERTAA